MLELLRAILYLFGIAILIGLLAGIPVFILGLALAAFSKLSGKKKTEEYEEVDIKAFKEIDDELEKAIKDYNIKDEKIKDKILSELLKSKGYKFVGGKLVKA